MTRAVPYGLLAVVAAAAAILSFVALRDLGLACGFPPQLAWLVPIVIDAGAAAGSVTWLSSPPGMAKVFGRRLAIVLLTASVIGNGIAHLLEAYRLEAAWWLVVAVSAVAPTVLAAVVHLTVVTSQQRTARPDMPVEPPVAPPRYEVTPEQGPVEDPETRKAALLAAGAGRVRLSKELGISSTEARRLAASRRNGHRDGVS